MEINTFQIIGIIVFVISSSVANIAFIQKRKHLQDRIGVFRDELLLDLFYLPASLLFIASSIYLGLSSWRLLLIVAAITIILTPIIINRLVLRFIIIPIGKKLFRWAEKREEARDGN
jgi:hypothetical protein